jgi:diphthine-ammonia ligase
MHLFLIYNSVCVQVNLPYNHQLHIDCIVGDTLKQHSEERDTLHVQGLSYWAPANIGPYSQCVRVSHHHYYCIKRDYLYQL